MKSNIIFSKESDHWKTPISLYNYYINEGYFDPCPYKSNFNGLLIEWKQKNFVNPPYSKIKEFVIKSIEEHKKGKDIILLIPARTDTKYFRMIVNYGCNIYFITGRLHFNSNSNSAPFPSCLICLTGKKTKCYWKDRSVIENE